MITFAKATGLVIRRARKGQGLTLSALAARSGLSQSFLSDVENGKRGVGLETWFRLACALDGRYATLLDEVVRVYRGAAGGRKKAGRV